MTASITETTSEQCFNVSINNDSRREDTEIFIVQFEVTNSQGSFMYDPINSTVYIEDDDGNIIKLGYRDGSTKVIETRAVCMQAKTLYIHGNGKLCL